MNLRRLLTGLFVLTFFAQAASGGDLRHLLPRPKASFDRGTGFIVTDQTPIVVPDNADAATLRAAAYLKAHLFKQVGKNPSIIGASQYDGPRGIFIGVHNTWPALTAMMHTRVPDGEVLDKPQGYVLDIDETAIMLEGADASGLFNGVVTIVQLTNLKAGTATTVGAHVYDYPDYTSRWIFSQHNLLVNSSVSALRAIADTMAAFKLNGIQQNDFKYSILQTQGSNYFANVDSLKAGCVPNNVEIIPGVVGLGWSDGILYNDPNLAEGVHAVSKYVIEADTGRLLPDPRVTIANGGFENYDANNKFLGWTFYDGQNDPSYVDHAVHHGGLISAKCSNFHTNNPAGNARFNTLVNCDSNGYYVMSFWYKTDANYSGGEVQLLAIGGTDGRTLTFTSLALQPNMDWTRAEVTFNTLGNTSVNLYCGVWGAVSGTIWFDDFQVKPGGLCNVLRRSGTPLTVTSATSSTVYAEGVDFAPIDDQILDASHGAYFPWHTPPTFRRLANGRLHNGDTIKISYYHPFAAVSDNSGNGSVMACVSEDSLYGILRDQVTRVNNMYHGASFFMGHDEIRNMNRDAACLSRGKSPAVLLSDNVTKCHDLIRSIVPSSNILVWSDMFDSLHNAKNNYYLVNGDLRGDWLNLPKDLTIVNWNSTYARKSLQFFSTLGYQQITSPYYDVGDLTTIRSWRLAQDSISGVRGMMYTTWQGDYRYIVPFAYYAWGAGPNILHVPLDSSRLSGVSIDVDAEVYPDPYDTLDNIPLSSAVNLLIYNFSGQLQKTVELGLLSKNKYHATATNIYPNGYAYQIAATNKQGLTRYTPMYRVEKQTFVAKPGSLTGPDTLDFGNVMLTTTKNGFAPITNSPVDGLTVVMDSGVVNPSGTIFSPAGIIPGLFLGGATKQVKIACTPTALGNYTATLRMYYSHGQVKDVLLRAHIIPFSGVESAPDESLDVSVVPNPFSVHSVVTVRGASPSLRITLADILGHVTVLPSNEQILLDPSQLGLHQGTYVLRVEDGAKTITRKVVYVR